MKRRRFIKDLSALPFLRAFAGLVYPHDTQGKDNALAESQTPKETRTALRIGSEKQLFIDEDLIATSKNVTLTMNPPLKTGEANIVAEHPWEDFYAGGWNTVMEDEGVYKMWYDSASISDPLSARKRVGRFVCYATSRDGIQWEKPVLGLVEFRGSRQNNILMRDTTGAVFLDPNKAGGDRFRYTGWWMGDG